jgi:hypothetical protein
MKDITLGGKNMNNESNEKVSDLQFFENNSDEQLDLLNEFKEESYVDDKPKKKSKKKSEVEEVSQEETEDPYVHTGSDGTRYTEWEWNSPVVRNGPTRKEVEGWKERHGETFFVPFGSEVYIFRTLKRPEYREIIRDTALTALDREELFTEKVVLYPYDFSLEKIKKAKAGVASLLSEMVMDKSGFVAQSAPIKL